MSVERLSLVLNHSRARGTDKVVLIGIANHDGDGGAWPSLATLARYANVDERTVRRSIASLISLGELAVEYNSGGGGSTRPDRRPNLYRILIDPPTSHGGTPTSVRDGSHGGTSTSERGDAHVTHGGTPTSPEPSIEPSSNQLPPVVPQTLMAAFESEEKRTKIDQRFEEFWDVYPRKAGKRAARIAYERALERVHRANPSGDASYPILVGARHYRDDPNREDTYTAHPSTWLNQDRWEDEPLPARAGTKPSATALYLDAADSLTWLDESRAIGS